MAATDFTGFTAETLDFLAGLKLNNTREWFAANKSAYERAVKKPAQAFSQLMAAEIERLTGAAHNPKIFRINRDVRFSKDKSPYNTHIHMSWSPAAGGDAAPAFMFGLSTEYCTVGCGVFEFRGATLDAWRAAIAGPGGEDFARLVDGLTGEGYRQGEPDLKRVPTGFDADLPQAGLLRHKGYVLWRDFEGPAAATGPGIARRSLGDFERLIPVWRFIAALSQY